MIDETIFQICYLEVEKDESFASRREHSRQVLEKYLAFQSPEKDRMMTLTDEEKDEILARAKPEQVDRWGRVGVGFVEDWGE